MRPSAATRRVVVTGVGVVAPCGVGVGDFWTGLLGPGSDLAERRVGEFGADRLLSRIELRRTDRFTQFALVAADEALTAAGLNAGWSDDDPGGRAGVIIGTGIGGASAFEAAVRVIDSVGPHRVSPYTSTMVMPNAAAAAVSLRWGLRGPSEAVSTACASGTHAIGRAARMVASGECDVMVAGGAEACLTSVNLASFTTIRAMSRSGVSRPFDAARDGFCAAEGAGILVLEDLESARARGARVLMEITGAASTSDAHHITAPPPDGAGALACMRLAMADAGLDPDRVAHVNAHGTSTELNDIAESRAVMAALGGHRPPVTSVKGVVGHGLGAAGGIEAVAVALTIGRGVIPPTAGTTDVDPDIEVDVVLEPREWVPGPVLSNSFGFGGHNGTLVLEPLRP